ncbi:MAG: transglycosylase domain-containing protein [Clostridia bacterium]
MRTENKKNEPSFWSIFSNTFWAFFKLVIAVVLLVGALTGGLGIGLVVGWIRTADAIQEEDLEIRTGLTTFIYDSAGNIIARLTGKDNINREPIGYDQINLYLEHAIISIEDQRFYEHQGFDIIRLGSSVVSLIVNRGEITQGGSTLTQQVYKNYTMRFEQTFERKFQEIYNSMLMEMKYDKKQIITMYVNIVNMGNGNYGFQSASKMYLGKDAIDVNIAEAAFLAAIPNAPSIYNPYTITGFENCTYRQMLVLDKMLELEWITEPQYQQALEYEIVIVPKDDVSQPDTYTSYFVDHVIDEVIAKIAEEKGVSKEVASQWVYNNGYHIHTTMDSLIQDQVDSIFLDPQYFPLLDANEKPINLNAEKYGETPQASIVIIDHKTGEIKAMYGGSGEKEGSRTYNRATQAKRQPGSSFKPIAIYAPGIDLELITAATIIDDVPVRLDPKNPEDIYPTNYISLSYKGLTTVRNAIKASVNVAAARVFVEILGRDNCVEYLKRVGIDRSSVIYDDSTVSVATGGLEIGVSALEMSGAFTAFANKGFFLPPHSFREVLDNRGNIVVSYSNVYTVAYSEQTAFIMTDILSEATKPANTPYGASGTAYGRISIQEGLMPVSGKTGTTSDYLDKWFVGFTPYYTAAVWYGYDNKIQPIRLERPEYNQALIIWNAAMNLIHESYEPKPFEKPLTGIEERNICIYSGQIATDLCRHDPRGNTTFREYFITGTQPSFLDECTVHSAIPQCTASQDSSGRYLLANLGFCPDGLVIHSVGIIRPVPYIRQDPNDPPVSDTRYEKPAGEYCVIHGRH